MLADLVQSFPTSPIYRSLHPAQRVIYDHLATRVREAQRFVLQRDATLTIHSISETSPKRFLSALGVCRLPFPIMWVEFPYQDRVDWTKDAAKRGLVVVSHADASPPSRLGFLIEQEDDKGEVLSILPVWTHHGTEVSTGYMAFRIDVREDFTIAQKEVENIRRGCEWQVANPPDGPGGFAKFLRKPDEFEAVVQLEARIRPFIPPFIMPLWNNMADVNPAAVEKMADLARFDLRSEWRFALALLVTLNSRNVINFGQVEDYAKLNKARVKSGKPPLLPHREIRLSLSSAMRRRATLSTGQYDSLQEHIVIGHWKVRKSGVFWWSPHMRGWIGDAKPRTYNVVS